jgi:ankyrin repeat protein
LNNQNGKNIQYRQDGLQSHRCSVLQKNKRFLEWLSLALAGTASKKKNRLTVAGRTDDTHTCTLLNNRHAATLALRSDADAAGIATIVFEFYNAHTSTACRYQASVAASFIAMMLWHFTRPRRVNHCSVGVANEPLKCSDGIRFDAIANSIMIVCSNHRQRIQLNVEIGQSVFSRMSLLDDFAEAVNRGNTIWIDALLASGSIDANARMPRKQLPPALLFAVRHSQNDVVDLLLRFGARIDDSDEDGRTACHVAARRNADLLALLLARRPNLGLKNATGQSALDLAVQESFGKTQNATMLIEAGAPLDSVGEHVLCQLAATSVASLQALLKRGVVVRALRDRDGRTPLHWACRERGRGQIGMLVNCGIDLEARDNRGKTCIHAAASKGNVRSLRWLVEVGANFHTLDQDGRTPLFSAGHCYQCTVVLLAIGVDVHARDSGGRTAAHMWCNAARVVPALVAAGADLDSADFGGTTARQLLADLADHGVDRVNAARRDIAKARLDFVRYRALQVCIGLLR